MAFFEEADCLWQEGHRVVLGFRYLRTPVRDYDQDSEGVALGHGGLNM